MAISSNFFIGKQKQYAAEIKRNMPTTILLDRKVAGQHVYQALTQSTTHANPLPYYTLSQVPTVDKYGKPLNEAQRLKLLVQQRKAILQRLSNLCQQCKSYDQAQGVKFEEYWSGSAFYSGADDNPDIEASAWCRYLMQPNKDVGIDRSASPRITQDITTAIDKINFLSMHLNPAKPEHRQYLQELASFNTGFSRGALPQKNENGQSKRDEQGNLMFIMQTKKQKDANGEFILDMYGVPKNELDNEGNPILVLDNRGKPIPEVFDISPREMHCLPGFIDNIDNIYQQCVNIQPLTKSVIDATRNIHSSILSTNDSNVITPIYKEFFNYTTHHFAANDTLVIGAENLITEDYVIIQESHDLYVMLSNLYDIDPVQTLELDGFVKKNKLNRLDLRNDLNLKIALNYDMNALAMQGLTQIAQEFVYDILAGMQSIYEGRVQKKGEDEADIFIDCLKQVSKHPSYKDKVAQFLGFTDGESDVPKCLSEYVRLDEETYMPIAELDIEKLCQDILQRQSHMQTNTSMLLNKHGFNQANKTHVTSEEMHAFLQEFVTADIPCEEIQKLIIPNIYDWNTMPTHDQEITLDFTSAMLTQKKYTNAQAIFTHFNTWRNLSTKQKFIAEKMASLTKHDLASIFAWMKPFDETQIFEIARQLNTYAGKFMHKKMHEEDLSSPKDDNYRENYSSSVFSDFTYKYFPELKNAIHMIYDNEHQLKEAHHKLQFSSKIFIDEDNLRTLFINSCPHSNEWKSLWQRLDSNSMVAVRNLANKKQGLHILHNKFALIKTAVDKHVNLYALDYLLEKPEYNAWIEKNVHHFLAKDHLDVGFFCQATANKEIDNYIARNNHALYIKENYPNLFIKIMSKDQSKIIDYFENVKNMGMEKINTLQAACTINDTLEMLLNECTVSCGIDFTLENLAELIKYATIDANPSNNKEITTKNQHTLQKVRALCTMMLHSNINTLIKNDINYWLNMSDDKFIGFCVLMNINPLGRGHEYIQKNFSLLQRANALKIYNTARLLGINPEQAPLEKRAHITKIQSIIVTHLHIWLNSKFDTSYIEDFYTPKDDHINVNKRNFLFELLEFNPEIQHPFEAEFEKDTTSYLKKYDSIVTYLFKEKKLFDKSSPNINLLNFILKYYGASIKTRNHIENLCSMLSEPEVTLIYENNPKILSQLLDSSPSKIAKIMGRLEAKHNNKYLFNSANADYISKLESINDLERQLNINIIDHPEFAEFIDVAENAEKWFGYSEQQREKLISLINIDNETYGLNQQHTFSKFILDNTDWALSLKGNAINTLRKTYNNIKAYIEEFSLPIAVEKALDMQEKFPAILSSQERQIEKTKINEMQKNKLHKEAMHEFVDFLEANKEALSSMSAAKLEALLKYFDDPTKKRIILENMHNLVKAKTAAQLRDSLQHFANLEVFNHASNLMYLTESLPDVNNITAKQYSPSPSMLAAITSTQQELDMLLGGEISQNINDQGQSSTARITPKTPESSYSKRSSINDEDIFQLDDLNLTPAAYDGAEDEILSPTKRRKL